MDKKPTLDRLYDLITGDEDARVCKDIPDAACNDQPRNFFAYLGANLLNKVADELASAKLVLPWLMSALAAPAALTGFLVPIREGGVLLPQLAVAAYIRRMPLRKGVWILGALLSSAALALMAVAATSLSGAVAGWAIIGLLVFFSLARGLCSVSSKDVLGKTVSKSRRGRLMGLSTGIAGIATLGLGLYIQLFTSGVEPTTLFFAMIGAAAVIFAVSAIAFAGILEQPGATGGGENALSTALQSLSLLKTDASFRRFLVARALLLSVALAPPFYVVLAQEHAGKELAGLGLLIIASGLAGSLSAPLWGRLSDRSSRSVIALAAAAAGLLGVTTWCLAESRAGVMDHELTYAVLFLGLAVAHSGVRLGRKVYLVDLATAETRGAYVAVSNTLIGVAMLFGGLVGIVGDLLDTASVILVLGVLSLLATGYSLRLDEVSDEDS